MFSMQQAQHGKKLLIPKKMCWKLGPAPLWLPAIFETDQ